MKKIQSTQRNVSFVFCPSPVTIDKRGEWGDNADNLQHGAGGAFLKMKDQTTVSHLVQPNEDKTAPIGWVVGSGPGLFDKTPIWIEEEVLPVGSTKVLQTLDGVMSYEVKKPSVVCYNDLDGKPNQKDSWAQTLDNLRSNYILD
jgi:hypothetical protein